MLKAENRLARKRLDKKLFEYRELKTLNVPPKGWVRAIRNALGMSSTQLAKRLGVVSQSVDDLEASEASHGIELDTLRKAATALDCTLVYALIPNRPLEQIVEERARRIAEQSLDRVDQTMALESQQVNASREELVEDFIREHIRDRDIWNQ